MACRLRATLNNHTPSRHRTGTSPLLRRWTAWLGSAMASAPKHRTSDTAAMLDARAAHYEATQPSFAADLRAAAEGLDRVAARQAR